MSNLIPSSWAVPNIFRERLGQEYGKQRLMHEDAHLLFILHKIPQAGKPEREGILFWRDPHGEWQTNLPGAGKQNLHQFLEDYRKRIDELENDLENATTATAFFALQKSIIPVSRAMKNSARVFQSAREQAPKATEIDRLAGQSICFGPCCRALSSGC